VVNIRMSSNANTKFITSLQVMRCSSDNH